MDAMKTGALITAARKERNLTQKDLAQALHVSAQAVSKWECGKSFPDVSMLEPLSRELGLTVSELLAGERDAPPREELVRDFLRMSLGQLGGKVRTWRGLFALTAGALVLLAAWQGFAWLRDNCLPQTQTILTSRQPTDTEALAASLGSGGDLAFYDITYADGTSSAALSLELWEQGQQTGEWPIGGISQGDWPRRETMALVLDAEPSGTVSCGAALGGVRFERTVEGIPYLKCGFGSNVLTERTAADRENGVVLACWYLDPTLQGRWHTAPCLGAVEGPVETDQAYLLLRIRYEYG